MEEGKISSEFKEMEELPANNEKFLDLAVESKASFYGNNSLPSDRLEQRLDWFRKEFTKVFEEESARIEALAQKERDRVMANILAKEEQMICPICLEDLSSIQSYEKRHRKLTLMSCCGQCLCGACADKVAQIENAKKVPSTCPVCRQRFPLTGENLVRLADAGKKWLLCRVAQGYAGGSLGLKKNKEKAREYYIKAAESGDVTAQGTITRCYFNGEAGFPRSVPLARKWASEALEKGDKDGQAAMAVIECSEGNLDRAHHLQSLAAYQGHPRARYNLMLHYCKKLYDPALKAEDVDRVILLALYWVAKATETNDTHKEYNSKALMHTAELMNNFINERCFEPERWLAIEPMTGRSHIPFCVWAINKAEKLYPSCRGSAHKNKLNIWKLVCANCGSREKSKLKMCSRCEAFSYCSKKCQVKHWKDGHKVDCKGHWIESFFPNMRRP